MEKEKKKAEFKTVRLKKADYDRITNVAKHLKSKRVWIIVAAVDQYARKKKRQQEQAGSLFGEDFW